MGPHREAESNPRARPNTNGGNNEGPAHDPSARLDYGLEEPRVDDVARRPPRHFQPGTGGPTRTLWLDCQLPRLTCDPLSHRKPALTSTISAFQLNPPNFQQQQLSRPLEDCEGMPRACWGSQSSWTIPAPVVQIHIAIPATGASGRVERLQHSANSLKRGRTGGTVRHPRSHAITTRAGLVGAVLLRMEPSFGLP